MFIKKFLIFASFCLGTTVCFADYITFDTAALDAAMNEITRVGSDSPYKTVEEAGDALFDAFYAAKKGNVVDSDVVMEKCFNEIIKSGRICNNFIETYNKYLDHANYCLKANNFKVYYNNKTYSFKDCYRYIDHVYHNRDGSIDIDLNNPDDGKYAGTSLTGQCKQWTVAAENCSKYLIGLYQQKYNDEKKDKNAQNTYKCVIEKIQTGEISFPFKRENLEHSCDDKYKQQEATYMFEALGY